MRRGPNRSCSDRAGFCFDLSDIAEPFEAMRSPYPYYYESKTFTRDGTLITVRPIKRDDAGRLVDFFDTLSRETIFFRFLTNLQSLPLDWVRRFTDIDYREDIAMVAVIRSDHDEQIVGVCRVMRCAGADRGEIAVVVGDPWHGQGIGTTLLRRTLHIARELGFRNLWGLVSSSNAKVARMAEKIGFVRRVDAEGDLFEVEIDLEKIQDPTDR